MRDFYGLTALHQAASSGHESVLMALLERGAGVTIRTNDGWTALHFAAWCGHKDIAVALLERGADISSSDNYGWTALHLAVSKGHTDVVKALLERDADVTLLTKKKWTALHFAAAVGNKDVAGALLQKDVDITIRNDEGWTALHCAAWKGYEDVVLALLERDAIITARDNTGWTALHRAAWHKHKSTVATLLHAEAKETTLSRPIGSQVEEPGSSHTIITTSNLKNEVEFFSMLCSLRPDDHIFRQMLQNSLNDSTEASASYNTSLEPVSFDASVDKINYAGGVYCDDCRQLIIGDWHACMMCEDFALCQKCYLKPIRYEHSSGTSHQFAKIDKIR